MTWTRLIVLVCWCYFLLLAYALGNGIVMLGEAVPGFAWPPVFMIALFFGIGFGSAGLGAFFGRLRAAAQWQWLRGPVDRFFGDGTLDGLLPRLNPTWLMAAVCGLTGGIGVATTARSHPYVVAYLLSGLFLSVAAGLIGACLLSLRFPPRVV